MGKPDFLRDLGQVKAAGKFKYLSKVKAGDSDGSICFTFTCPDAPTSIEYQAITEPQDYPQSHQYFVYSTSDPSPAVIEAVENAVMNLSCISIQDLLTAIESTIHAALNGSKLQPHERYPDDDRNTIDDSDGSLDEFDDSGEFDYDEHAFYDSDVSPLPYQAPSLLRQKIREDLRAVKNTGFKVGYVGEVSESSFIVSVASRLNRLGIPEEVMDVWKVCPKDYLVLLIRYPRGYVNMEDLFERGDPNSSLIQMHLGLCDSYKPSTTAALMAFQGSTPTEKDGPHPQETERNRLRPFFIGCQLNRLMSERFMGIVRLRLRWGLFWTGAENLFQASQGKALDDKEASSEEYITPDEWETSPPPLLMTDHMADEGFVLSRMSFPLLAMQFTLRHFVRCTEFCLVCFCKKYDDFEAMKPYVCSNGLCLYQYITYGLGPSLEYEVKSQSSVVDMLVSLAFIRAKTGKLEDFPTGLGMRIPNTQTTYADELRSDPSTDNWLTNYHTGTMNTQRMFSSNKDIPRIIMELSRKGEPRLIEGQWIAFVGPEGESDLAHGPSWHCRVQNVGFNYVELSFPLRWSKQMTEPELKQATSNWRGSRKVHYAIYDTDFDDLTKERKQKSIVMLLGTLPGIDEMIKYLTSQGPDATLSSWHDRIQPAALDLLRWIVASNRSCIIQDNSNPEHLVSDMKDYVQFRLVQGAPDKEQRFITAINENSRPQYPTIFAWHGSPLYNWHSILREGLHFKDTAHGRAYGHGVYMSPHFQTSLSYVGAHQSYFMWPQSNLVLSSIISLNEIVNAPTEFLHTQPHYVVTQLDWIQPRYLFVGIKGINDAKTSSSPSLLWDNDVKKGESPTSVTFYAQDPQHTASGPSGAAIKIPISAISARRREKLALKGGARKRTTSKKEGKKKTSKSMSSLQSSTDASDELQSVATDIEDLEILFSDSDIETIDVPRKKTCWKKATKYFTPPKETVKGKEAIKHVPPPPTSSQAVEVQQKERLHELGWFVDPGLTSGNLYQWIVELHSFEKELPLAKDLKAAKLTSVVLELRFPPNYPMDPPFVRVIRPLFLEFQAGGGGHITLGGAMCMELLTSTGWSAVTCIESLLLQVRLAITSTDPRPARLSQRHGTQDYTVGEAVESYKRACIMHGWKVPQDLELMRW
ncbi:Protein CMS1 [Penicillium atrosanguineum]|uniref:PARP catalytic domain-containing protein n=1 Tax=Penicillium atrosanguineum TaxID=1132637 RepID=A0A9W9PNM7_9EURO|nr:Protein CMS1 [Penicillium atrosanguineum]KAJ5296689.1 Protein CMS1 [Penicillium atrosanguineum]KAJ5299452.1 hypothetical protein N7476_011009 [Penicillium atrosanguineum]